MKYDSSMTQFHGDIVSAIKAMIFPGKAKAKELASEGSPVPLREFIKRYGKDRFGGRNFECTPNAFFVVFDNIILNNSGEKKLQFSWSQVATFIRNNAAEIFDESEEESEKSNMEGKTYLDILKEHYPNVDCDVLYGDYCPEDFFDGALGSTCNACTNQCSDCWNMSANEEWHETPYYVPEEWKASVEQEQTSEDPEISDEEFNQNKAELEKFVSSVDEKKIACPHWIKRKTLNNKGFGAVEFECAMHKESFFEEGKLKHFLTTHCYNQIWCPFCDHPEAVQDKQPSDFPCDNCGYDEKGCCNYPETPDDYCVMGDKQVPTTKEHTEISDKYAEAVQLNAQIMTSARAAQQNLYDMAVGFKKMRDDKLYKELGYDSFGDYCEAETGMTRVNVYNYISIVEKLPSDFVKSTLQIGKEKLYLLSTVEESQRTEIIENTDLESTTVRDLKKQIEQLRKSEEDIKAELELAQFHEKQSHEAFNRVADASKANFEKYKEERHKNDNLEKRIKELEARPIDVAVDVDEVNRRVAEAVSRINSETEHTLAAERRDFADTINAKDDKIWALEDKIKELESRPVPSNGEKIFALKMTMDQYAQLVDVINASKDKELSAIIKKVKIFNV